MTLPEQIATKNTGALPPFLQRIQDHNEAYNTRLAEAGKAPSLSQESPMETAPAAVGSLEALIVQQQAIIDTLVKNMEAFARERNEWERMIDKEVGKINEARRTLAKLQAQQEMAQQDVPEERTARIAEALQITDEMETRAPMVWEEEIDETPLTCPACHVALVVRVGQSSQGGEQENSVPISQEIQVNP